MRPDYGRAGFSHPDFVMLGVDLGPGNGVMVVASSTLTQAEVEQHLDQVDVTCIGDDRRHYIPGFRWCSIRAEMYDLVIVYGADYAEAFAKLFADWSPTPKPRRKLGAGAKAVEAARPELAP